MKSPQFGVAAALWATLLPAAAFAQKSEPSHVYLFPAGGRRGTTVSAKLEGENITTLCDLHLQRASGLKSAPQARDRKAEIRIAPEAPLGPSLIRIATTNGGAGSRAFVVGDEPEIMENEPGADSLRAQALTLPVTVNGRLDLSGDQDRFSVDLQSGQSIWVEVYAARLGGPVDTNIFSGQFGQPTADPTENILDSELEILDPSGSVAAVSHDQFGRDPALRFTAKRAGLHTISLHHLAYLGRPQFIYRLTVRAEPGSPATLAARDAGMSDALMSVTDRFQGEQGAVHSVSLAAGKSYRVETWCERLGAAVDARVQILDPAGKVLASADDGIAGTRDPALTFTAPADGEFRVRLLRSGKMPEAPEYSLALSAVKPDFMLASAVEFVDVAPGKAADVKVDVTRLGGLTAPIRVWAEGLPAGVTGAPVTANPGQAQIRLSFKADAAALSGSADVRIVAEAANGDETLRREAVFAVVNPADWAQGAAPRTRGDLLVTVTAPAPFEFDADDSYLFLNLGSIHPARVFIKRQPGFTAPMRISMADRQPRDPYGITYTPIEVPDGKSEAFIPMYLPQGPRGNEITRTHVRAEAVIRDAAGREVHFLRTAPKNVVARTQAPVMSLSAITEVVRGYPGSSVDVTFRLGRTAATKEQAEIQLVDVSGATGLKFAPVQIPAGQTDATGRLEIASDAALGLRPELWFEARSRRDNGQTVFFRTRVELDLRTRR